MKQVALASLLVLCAAGIAWHFHINAQVAKAEEATPAARPTVASLEAATTEPVPAKRQQRSEAEIAATLLQESGKSVSRETYVAACAKADYSTLELLSKAGFDSSGEAASEGLKAAIQSGETGLTRRLLEAGAALPQIEGFSALAWCLVNRKDEGELISMLLKADAKPDPAALLSALEMGNRPVVETLLERNTPVDIKLNADGRTPLMFAAGLGWQDIVSKLIAAQVPLDVECNGGWTAWNYALKAGYAEIAGTILRAMPVKAAWNDASRQQFADAVAQEDMASVGVLFRYLSPEPVVDTSNQPLLLWAIAWRKPNLVHTLLESGANAGTELATPVDPAFQKQINDKDLNYYLESEKGMTALMLAAGLGELEIMRELIAKGARPGALTRKHKMAALSFAARGNHVKPMQLLLGVSESDIGRLHVEISLANQRVRLYKSGRIEYETKCSTGRKGFSTPTGEFVITGKDRLRVSNLYDAEMPFFMRLSESPVGMHQGVVPDFPASHGCIRLPREAAKRLFGEVPVGTLVVINQ